MNSRTPRVLAGLLCAATLVVSFGSLAAAQDKKKPATKAPAGPTAADIAAGKKVYVANGCTACHAIGDTGGKTGPDLSHIGKEKKADWLTKQVRDPKKIKADSTMPAYGADKITDKQMKTLVAYMGSLK